MATTNTPLNEFDTGNPVSRGVNDIPDNFYDPPNLLPDGAERQFAHRLIKDAESRSTTNAVKTAPTTTAQQDRVALPVDEEADETQAIEATEPSVDDEVEEVVEFERNGKIYSVPLSELSSSYVPPEERNQPSPIVAAKLTKLEEQEKTFNNLIATAQASIYADPIFQKTSSMTPADWLALTQTDAHEALILEKKHNAAVYQLQQLQRQSEEAYRASLTRKAEQEIPKLYNIFPEWKDPSVKDAQLKKMNDYGLSKGFTPEELGAMTDSRLFAVLADAQKWRDSQSVAQSAEAKKVVTAKKTVVLKSGARAQPKQETREDFRKLARSGASDRDLASWIAKR